MSSRYTLAWRTAARKDLKRLDRQVAARILRRLADLQPTRGRPA